MVRANKNKNIFIQTSVKDFVLYHNQINKIIIFFVTLI